MGYAKSRTVVYDKLEWNAGNMCDGGRDLEGPEAFEYCESLFLEAWDSGRCRPAVPLRIGEDVIRGVSGGWFGFADGGDRGDCEVVGDELDGKTAVIFQDVFTKTH